MTVSAFAVEWSGVSEFRVDAVRRVNKRSVQPRGRISGIEGWPLTERLAAEII